MIYVIKEQKKKYSYTAASGIPRNPPPKRDAFVDVCIGHVEAVATIVYTDEADMIIIGGRQKRVRHFKLQLSALFS